VVMHRGAVVESGPAAAVLTAPQNDYTRRLIESAPSLATESLVRSEGPEPRPVIEVTGLRKEYPVRTGALGRRAVPAGVDDVSFTVPRGRTVGIVGESGSGKSTTANMLLMLEPSTAGAIVFDDKEVTGLTGRDLFAFRRRVQPVFQNPYAALDPRYTVGD